MKQFFRFMMASCLGLVLAAGIIVGIIMLIAVGAASKQDKPEKIKPNSVLELKFNEPVPELTNNVERDPFDLNRKDVLGLQDIVHAIEAAREDKNIKGLLIRPEMSGMGISTISEIRDALLEFRESGKFIISYGEFYTQGSYFLASTADEVYIHPMGNIDFRGFAAVIPFFKETLDKIGIEMKTFYAGDFKSATEPFRRTEMSEQSKLQMREFLESVYSKFLDQVAANRGTSVAHLDSVANNLLLRDAQAALELGFVDKVGYYDEVKESIRERLGLEEDEKIEKVTVNQVFNNHKPKKDYDSDDKLAVIYAEGEINNGDQELGMITEKQYLKVIRKVRKDEKVKAIVLRVNSPGGSGLVSENIWRELMLAKEEGKKIVVSMGDYAASGGYYISCAADSILAEEETLTGSIGVFSIFPNITELLNQKMGIHYDTVITAKYAAGFTPVLDMRPEEGAYFQNFVDNLYERFLQRVADARDMSRDEVHRIAQGRIWTGDRAMELGLVDKLGGLEDAIEMAAGMTGMEKYRLVSYPKPKDPMQQLIEEITNTSSEDVKMALLEKEMGAYGDQLKIVRSYLSGDKVQYRLPFSVKIY